MQIVVFHSYFTEFIIKGTKGPNENTLSVIHVMLWGPTGDNPLY